MKSNKRPIWQLVQRCAEELTEDGQTPFTRGDLIECVQRTHSHYNKDSINPIIQGITDNLRGGAPGAIGKNILHSVDRGRFVLKADSGIESESPIHQRANKVGPPDIQPPLEKPSNVSIAIGSSRFYRICDIQPERTDSGGVAELMPQDRYENVQQRPLNRYGAGPFCKFKIPNNHNTCGVYIVTVERSLKYIGECENLSERFNKGYGNISPRNCYKGGQETNCRINNLILREAMIGSQISLWFHHTEDYKGLELALRSTQQPEWNRT